MEMCNKSIKHRQTDADTTTYIVSKQKKLQNDIETFLDMPYDAAASLTDCHKTTLLVLQNENTISLNRPLLAMSKETPDYRAALQSCISAARSVVGHLHDYLVRFRQDPAMRAGINAGIVSPLLWPSFTWAIWQSAFIILYAAMEGELPKPNAMRYV
jgi:hypothetical protein